MVFPSAFLPLCLEASPVRLTEEGSAGRLQLLPRAVHERRLAARGLAGGLSLAGCLFEKHKIEDHPVLCVVRLFLRDADFFRSTEGNNCRKILSHDWNLLLDSGFCNGKRRTCQSKAEGGGHSSGNHLCLDSV